MNIEEIITGMNEVFKDVLEIDDLSINADTTANDVEDWDSINHIIIVVGIEKRFNVKFNSDEIHAFKNVGEMADTIKLKMTA